MIDLEIFITTNGRSTFEYCIHSILEQSRPTTFTVIRNKKWKTALHEMVERCRAPYFMRVDDDFVLHSKAVEYIARSFSRLPETKSVAQYCCLLWETWTNKKVSGIKLYSKSAMKDIKGHHFDSFGKADKKTNQALKKAGYVLIRDRSTIGLHICGTLKEQTRYEKLWQRASKLKYNKSTNPEMRKYCQEHDLASQVKLCGKFLHKRNKYVVLKTGETIYTGFYHFLRTGRLSTNTQPRGVKTK